MFCLNWPFLFDQVKHTLYDIKILFCTIYRFIDSKLPFIYNFFEDLKISKQVKYLVNFIHEQNI